LLAQKPTFKRILEKIFPDILSTDTVNKTKVAGIEEFTNLFNSNQTMMLIFFLVFGYFATGSFQKIHLKYSFMGEVGIV